MAVIQNKGIIMKKINEEDGTSAMSSGPILQTSINDPGSEDAIYQLFSKNSNITDGAIQMSLSGEIESRELLKNNKYLTNFYELFEKITKNHK